MGKFCGVVVLATLCLYQFLSVSETSESVCRGDTGINHRISLTINSIRNDRDEWVSKFNASQNASVKSKNLDVDLTRSVIECEGSYYINVKGILRGNVEKNFQGAREGRVHLLTEDAEKSQKSLAFHHKCSSNVVIKNNSRTLQKLIFRYGREGSALTSRPLMDNEIFTIRIDDIGTALIYGYGVSIGLTTHEPGTFEIPEDMLSIGTGTWMLDDKSLYYKTTPIRDMRISKPKVGQRIGVMRSNSGHLHFFFDGVDQGSIASNIPEKIYGVFVCYGNLLQGTIVDA